ncbi:Gfo/Idh/MocA family protein [Paracoccus rhizosphaerae]|uniref:Gfo/Idh/MocA family protein n=1 Tax=Paracoccus rhizosphaerae TaxID=1133347 RepID=A0ABV6CJ39_9RHOB|nr:Gfo/Idh/MocA family oxidoreductase [Paracoccus rhizosphaerae]
MTLRIGCVGYGTGGRHFHTPFIDAAEGCELTAIVARAEKTAAKARSDWPGIPVFPSLAALIGSNTCDAVTITTPPQTRRELVLEAIAGGLHVIADKPFAPSENAALELDRAADAAGIVLGVYQNRRFDSDLQTLAKVLEGGRLGEVWRIHSRMDFDDPASLEAGPTGGLLRDLGSHLVDQMIYLLGPVLSVDCQMDHLNLPQGRTDASFTMTLRHKGGAHSHINASKCNHLNLRELRAYGSNGSFTSRATDVQAQQIFAGERPALSPETWGYEPESNWPILRVGDDDETVPAEQGRYHDYYAAFARSVRDGTAPPVTAKQAARTIAVLDAARRSAEIGASVTL